MQEIVKTMMIRPITTVGKYIMLMGRTFARPERMHMFFKQYLNEMVQLGVNSIGIVLLISFFIGAVITIKHRKPVDAPFCGRLHHPRNHVAGILLLHHVLDPVRKGRF